MKFYYTYVLESEKDGKHYTVYTEDLNVRFERHQQGQVQSTKHRRPMKMIYFEACRDRDDAIRREKYLKTHYGIMFIKNRLKSYFTRQE